MTRKNLIWLTIDSIRGDRTSVGGYERETTPTLASIGEEPNAVSGTCFAHAIWSQPSVASIMTGTYPARHGSGSFNETLPETIPTVAQRLSQHGYRTIGVSSNPYFSSTTGMERGFDRFDFVSGKELASEAGVRSLLSFVRNIRTFSGGFAFDKRKHSPDYLINEILKDRLRSQTGSEQPFFLAAHYYGAHHPYYPSPKFRTRFSSELSDSADQTAETVFEQTTDVYDQIAQSEAERTAVDAMYDAQVTQVDALIGQLVSAIDRLGLEDETILVITSDHGDLLGELGLFSHKLLLHDALINVPVVVRGSEALAGTDLGLAQHADIMQTILAELGVPTDGMQGIRLDQAEREMAVAQRGGETCEKTLTAVRERTPSFENEHVLPGFVTALRTEEWKFVSGADESALYRLPVETEDIKAEHPAVAARFSERLDEWLDSYGQPAESDSTAEFDDQVKRRLADLGYVE